MVPNTAVCSKHAAIERIMFSHQPNTVDQQPYAMWGARLVDAQLECGHAQRIVRLVPGLTAVAHIANETRAMV